VRAHVFAVRPVHDRDLGTLAADEGVEGVRAAFDTAAANSEFIGVFVVTGVV
jgi:hypothetical protein